MGYSAWFTTHGEKHAIIMQKLIKKSDAEVIAYFRFENMVKQEPTFCPLYKEHKKCHDIKELNCYLCACPNFRFNDKGLDKIEEKQLKSYCSIDSKDGAIFENEDSIHQDCTACTIPHHEAYISKYFKREWFEIMKKVKP